MRMKPPRTPIAYSYLVSSTQAINKGVLIGNVSHIKLITSISAFSTYFSSQLLNELEDDAPNVLAQTRVGEAEVERFGVL